MGKFYISAPVDEVVLAGEAAPVVAQYGGRLPSAENLRELARERSLDFATMVLYQAIHASPVDKAFIDNVDRETITIRHLPVNAKVLIIPALFHGHYPETGADAVFARNIALNCGFAADSIPIKSLATVTENADIIKDALEKEKTDNIWIFSISKGSADFRAFLQRYPASPSIARIKGWINVSGLANGCDIADHNTSTAWNRLKYRAICRLFKVSFEIMREIRTDHEYWQQKLVLPAHMKVFNFAAIPLGSHIQKALIGRYLAIRHVGPNDGMIACRSAIIDDGPTYPVWGCDHFFRSPQVIPTLYRFFSYLRTQ